MRHTVFRSVCSCSILHSILFHYPRVHKALRALLCLWASLQPSRSQALAPPSTPPILTEIVFLLGHLSRVGSCRCCWRLWSWEEVPATPKSKCFFFHFPVLVSFFLRCERRGGIPLGMIGTRFVWLSFPWSTGKPVLCVWIFVSSKRRILFYGGFQCTLITVRSKQNL